MAHRTDRIIIRQALDHPGLLTAEEVKFVTRISKLPETVRLSAGQVQWLYDIGRKKLGLNYQPPKRAPIIDYKSRACA